MLEFKKITGFNIWNVKNGQDSATVGSVKNLRAVNIYTPEMMNAPDDWWACIPKDRKAVYYGFNRDEVAARWLNEK